MYYLSHYSSPVGFLSLVATDDSLVGLWIEGQKYFKSTLTNPPIEQENLPILSMTKLWLDRYFRTIPLPFRQRISPNDLENFMLYPIWSSHDIRRGC